jgi:hypothetical protein
VTSDSPDNADPHRRFWNHHDLDSIVDVWGGVVGEDRIHLLTVPPAGAPPTLLWERFCSVLGIDPDRYDASQDKGSNFSLSLSDTELMRRINVELRPELDRDSFKRWATRFFANNVMRAGKAEQTKDDRAQLPPDAHEWAVTKSEEMVAELRHRQVKVVGDLDELVPSPFDPSQPASVNEPKVVYPDGAVDMIVKLVRRLAEVDPESGVRRSRGGASERGARRRERRRAADPEVDAAAEPGRRAARRAARQHDNDGPIEWTDEILYE